MPEQDKPASTGIFGGGAPAAPTAKDSAKDSKGQRSQVDGKDVTVLRDAAAGDPDFDAKAGPQKVVRREDGMEVAVLASKIKVIA